MLGLVSVLESSRVSLRARVFLQVPVFVVSGLPPADPEGRPEYIVEALLIAADNPPLELVETGTQLVGIERWSRRAHHLAVPRGTDLLIDVEQLLVQTLAGPDLSLIHI